mmetsp:Transcript_23028/g.28326  ORF Transcript_23028/g.28326 Transcript_23028/m.28326 type:complete len:135 (-) Transcript_23028:167-571(-)
MYTGTEFVLKVEEEERFVSSRVGVKQGDPMAPVLFLYIIMAGLELYNKHSKLTHPVKFMFSPKLSGTLSLTAKPTTATGTEFSFDKSAYGDDVALIFGSCEDIKNGSKTVVEQFAPSNATQIITLKNGTIPFTD